MLFRSFDLEGAGLPASARIGKATLSFYVWDPHNNATTKVCAFPVKTPWREATATWRQPQEGKAWQGGKSFVLGVDAGPPSGHVVVRPDMGSDTVDPPIEYQIDVTAIVQDWVRGTPNYGFAIVPVPDRAIDGGHASRFQVFASEHQRAQYTPKLVMQAGP